MGNLLEITCPERIRTSIERVLSFAPDTIRFHAREAILRSMDEAVSARGADEVSEDDMVRAIFRNTPEFYHHNIKQILQGLGFDLSPHRPAAPKDLVKMADDIVQSADIAEAGYNKKTIEHILHVFEDSFVHPSVPVTFRTTTKQPEKRGLNVRYVDFWNSHDPHKMALENGLIARYGHPIDDLFAEIEANFPVRGYGIDFEASNGFEKIWPFFPPPAPQPVEKAFAMSTLPSGVKNSSAFFNEFNLDRFGIFAMDYCGKSVNLYFMANTVGEFTPDRVVAIFQALDYKLPSREVIDYCARAAIFYPTFTWNFSGIERICFGVLAQEEKAVPTHLHPVVERYTSQAPIFGEKRKFIYGLTFARKGEYIKIENDYSGSMVDLLSVGAP